MITNFIYAYIFMQFSMYDSVSSTEDRTTIYKQQIPVDLIPWLFTKTKEFKNK